MILRAALGRSCDFASGRLGCGLQRSGTGGGIPRSLSITVSANTNKKNNIKTKLLKRLCKNVAGEVKKVFNELPNWATAALNRLTDWSQKSLMELAIEAALAAKGRRSDAMLVASALANEPALAVKRCTNCS